MTTPDERLDEALASDDILAARARLGSTMAFRSLVKRHCDAVYTVARNMSATLADADQVAKQTFLSAWRDLSSRPAPASFAVWMLGIAMRTALDLRRLQRRGGPSRPETLVRRPGAQALVPSGDWSDICDRSAGKIEIEGLLREALECMDDDVRASFVLRDLLELTIDEAAAVLQTSSQVVCQRVHRARMMLHGVAHAV
jgi:RNA polymerase sigma-70 factor (ECF subfamily)